MGQSDKTERLKIERDKVQKTVKMEKKKKVSEKETGKKTSRDDARHG